MSSRPANTRATTPLETERLQLLAASPDHLLALFDQPEQFAGRAGFPLAKGLRGLFVSGAVSPQWLDHLRRSAGTPGDPWLYGFFLVEKASGVIIGTAGFKGPPDGDGMVEIAYGIAPERQGQGFATEAAGALLRFAAADPRVHVLRAHTLPEPNASTHVLRKCGFAHLGEVIDPEDGPVWRWERSAPHIGPS
jgi:RimJ/RimL family protein N-acetyltransferase